MSGEPSDPQRTCVGCRRRRPAGALVRVTNGAVGVVIDGASDGRGAWICRTAGGDVHRACVDVAVRRGGFARAWRVGAEHIDLDALWRAVEPSTNDVPDEGLTNGKG